MSRENVEVATRLVQAFNERDMNALLDLTSPDFEFAPYLPALLETTAYRGHEGLDKYFKDADAAWEEIAVRLGDIREVDDRLTVSSGELVGKGRASGLEVRVPLAWVGEFHAGKMIRLTTYRSEAEALEAVGLRG